MALAGGHRRRAQIGGTALVLTVVAAAGVGQGEAVGASIVAPPSVTTGDSGRVPPTFSSDVVRGFESLQRPARTARKKANGKVIHLTFDDGPSARHTRPILDLLDRYDAKATFFQVGENAIDHPGLTRAIVGRGHALGSHTWNHRDLRRLKGGRLDDQITRTSRTLSRISGRRITCLRPPYGATNQRVKSAVRHRKLTLTLWDVDPRDWRKPGAATIAQRVIARARPGAVILLHDGGGSRSQTVQATRQILRTLGKKGYTFRSLPGC